MFLVGFIEGRNYNASQLKLFLDRFETCIFALNASSLCQAPISKFLDRFETCIFALNASLTYRTPTFFHKKHLMGGQGNFNSIIFLILPSFHYN